MSLYSPSKRFSTYKLDLLLLVQLHHLRVVVGQHLMLTLQSFNIFVQCFNMFRGLVQGGLLLSLKCNS